MQRLYLWKLLKARRQPFIYRVTKYANHAIELARELVEEKGCTQILVLGGDGTLSEVTASYKEYMSNNAENNEENRPI